MWQMCHQMTLGRSMLTVSWWSVSVLLCNRVICASRRRTSECIFDRICFVSVCVCMRVWEVRVLHQARPPSGLFTLPHTTQWDDSSLACKTWYEHSHRLINAFTILNQIQTSRCIRCIANIDALVPDSHQPHGVLFACVICMCIAELLCLDCMYVFAPSVQCSFRLHNLFIQQCLW